MESKDKNTKRKGKMKKGQNNSDAGNRTRGKHVRDAYVTNYTTSEFDEKIEKSIVCILQFTMCKRKGVGSVVERAEDRGFELHSEEG